MRKITVQIYTHVILQFGDIQGMFLSYIIINEPLFQYFEVPWKIAAHKAQGHLLRNVQFEGLLQTGYINPHKMPLKDCG